MSTNRNNEQKVSAMNPIQGKGPGTERRFSNAERLIYGLARKDGRTVWDCPQQHPLFTGSDGICPLCGSQSQVFTPPAQQATKGAAT